LTAIPFARAEEEHPEPRMVLAIVGYRFGRTLA